jgi:hypothetical protein
MVFSPDGKTLACAEDHNRILVYEVATGKPRRELRGHQAAVRALAWSADGRFLVSGGMDATALVWDVTGHGRAWRRQTADPSPGELEARWKALGEDDASGGALGVGSLMGAPRQTVAFVKEHLRPVPRTDAARIEGLIAGLDQEDFAARERASRELEKLDTVAAAALSKALAGRPSAEVRRRVENLLARLEAAPSGEWLRALRAIELLDYFATPEARASLEELAEGAPEARLTQEAKGALERLDRRPAP